MNDIPDDDPPVPEDRRRRWAARAASREAIACAREEFRRVASRALRAEIAATVRSVSPLLVGLLRAEGLELDDVVTRLCSARSWPTRFTSSAYPVMPGSPQAFVWGTDDYLLRERRHCLRLPLTSGEVALISVAAHSLEVEVRGLGVVLRTRFGVLSVIGPGSLPQTVVGTILGMPVAAIVSHPLLDRSDWRISGVEIGPEDLSISCRIGRYPYHPPGPV